MLQTVLWIVGVTVAIIVALFGVFGAVAAFNRSPASSSTGSQAQTNFTFSFSKK